MHSVVPNDGKAIPPVDPEALRRRWSMKEPWSSEAMQDARIHEVDFPAIFHRDRMVRMLLALNHGQLVAPWRHGDKLDDAVFRIAATFPMREFIKGYTRLRAMRFSGLTPMRLCNGSSTKLRSRMLWEPVPTRLAEGRYCFTFLTVTYRGQSSPGSPMHRDPVQAKRFTRDVLWDVWSKYHSLGSPEQVNKEAFGHMVAILFADFVMDNVDLARELMSTLSGRSEGAKPFAILTELERRAKAWKP